MKMSEYMCSQVSYFILTQEQRIHGKKYGGGEIIRKETDGDSGVLKCLE